MPPRPIHRRRSIFPGLLLIVIGALLLVATLRPGFSLGYVITHFWPVIIIVWGLSKLIDRFSQPRGAAPVALITGGEVGLIVLLVILVALVAFVGWVHNRRRDFWNIGPFTQEYSQEQHVNSGPLHTGSWVAISTPNGKISVQPGPDDAIHVVAHETARASTEQQARDRLKAISVVADRTEFGLSGDGYSVHPVNVSGRDIVIDLDVQIPKGVAVSSHTNDGDVTVAGIQGAATVSTRSGDLQVHDVGSNVRADIQNGDTHIRNVAGAVSFTGRGGGEVEIADVREAATLGGNVFGDVDLRNVAKGVHYSSPRANVQVGGRVGELKIDNSDVVLSGGTGPITITARNQDMQLDNVQGQLNLTETRGDINVTFAEPPNASINITDDAGDVTLNLPPQSNFSLYAQSNAGDITDDFAENPQHDDDHAPHVVSVTHGSGGPAIHIVTKYGDIHIGNSK